MNSYYVGDECLRHVDLNTKGRKDAVAQGSDIFTSIILLNNDFKRVFKIKMPLRKSFDYIYKKKLV